MKKIFTYFGIFTLMFGAAITASAQFDDVYYNPEDDYEYDNSSEDEYVNEEEVVDEDIYEGEDYYNDEDYDDYSYYYTSRIKRFHRPYRGFNYYDPIYTPWSGVGSFYGGLYERVHWLRAWWFLNRKGIVYSFVILA